MQTNLTSKNAGQRDVLKEIEACLCGSVSSPVRPHTLCVRDINPRQTICLRDKIIKRRLS